MLRKGDNQQNIIVKAIKFVAAFTVFGAYSFTKKKIKDNAKLQESPHIVLSYFVYTDYYGAICR